MSNVFSKYILEPVIEPQNFSFLALLVFLWKDWKKPSSLEKSAEERTLEKSGEES